MRSLFLKIFLWFWLANTLAIAALALVVWAFPYSTGRRPGFFERLHELQVRGALALRDSQGQEAFNRHAQELEEALQLRTFWIDEHGRELRGQTVPDHLLALTRANPVQSAPASPAREPGPPQPFVIALADAAGRPVRAVVESFGRRPGPYYEDFISSWEFALRVSAVVLVAGLGCYALARYLTSPVRRLEDAARRLAAGDFAARVGAPIASRRDEIGQLGREFDRMAGQVEALFTTHRRLLQDVSHELRSPLARLNVALELARRDAGPAALQPLARAGQEADRLNDLIGQLLTVARLDAESARPQHTPIDLHALVASVVDDAHFEATASGRVVRLTTENECEVLGAPELLHSAIENVVRNAVHHAPPGSKIDVSLATTVRDAQRVALVRVRDHGPGVPEDALANIFRPFYRVSDARETQSGGAGLGLAITQRAIRIHRGHVRASNADGGGLLVELELPCASHPSQ